jgi:hypothetical protein
MIKRLMTKVERYAEQDERTEQPRLSMVWCPDPTTGKLSARWVCGATDATTGQQLPAAA